MPTATLSAMGFDTPFGELNVIATARDATVRAAGFSPLRDVVAQLPREMIEADLDDSAVARVADAVESWLADGGDSITEVPVSLAGSPFFVEVWQRLRSVPAGEVVSYQELAQMAGRPRAMRAVGTACARNTVGLFVPCHRVIASGGRLGSYGFGGPGIKAALLAHEGVHVADAPVTEGSRVAVATAATADARASALSKVAGERAHEERAARRVREAAGGSRPAGEW